MVYSGKLWEQARLITLQSRVQIPVPLPKLKWGTTMTQYLEELTLIFWLAVILALSGCSTPAGQASFWTECVRANGYGLSMFTPYGPVNFGYLTWERNVNCDKDIKQAEPVKPLSTLDVSPRLFSQQYNQTMTLEHRYSQDELDAMLAATTEVKP